MVQDPNRNKNKSIGTSAHLASFTNKYETDTISHS